MLKCCINIPNRKKENGLSQSSQICIYNHSNHKEALLQVFTWMNSETSEGKEKGIPNLEAEIVVSPLGLILFIMNYWEDLAEN